MEKEIWNILKSSDFINVPDLSKLRILDIGCGPGNAFYHFFADFGTTYFTGIEKKSKDKIEENLCAFKTYGCQKLSKCLEDHHSDNKSIDLFFYFKKLLTFNILNNIIKINESQFNAIFLNKKIQWGTGVESSNIFFDKHDKFDLIILSKVLHYQFIKDPISLIENCINLLEENGFIFIKSRKIEKENSKLRKVDKIIFSNWIKNLEKYKEIDDNNDFLYFLGIRSS